MNIVTDISKLPAGPKRVAKSAVDNGWDVRVTSAMSDPKLDLLGGRILSVMVKAKRGDVFLAAFWEQRLDRDKGLSFKGGWKIPGPEKLNAKQLVEWTTGKLPLPPEPEPDLGPDESLAPAVASVLVAFPGSTPVRE